MPVIGLDYFGRLRKTGRDPDGHARREKIDVTRAMGGKVGCHIS
jgi:hypothetical protein